VKRPVEELLPRLLLVGAVLIVPWAVWLLATLPERREAHHWGVAWCGLDLAIALTVAATALGAMRRPALLATAGPMAAALLLADAWFDTVTAGTISELALAIGFAVCLELPLAAVCLWLTTRIAARSHELGMRERQLRA